MSATVSTEPQVTTQSTVQPTVEPKVDAHLSTLWEEMQTGEAKSFANICNYIKANKVPRDVVRKTLEAPKSEGGREMTPGSVKAQMTYIKNLTHPDNEQVLKDLSEGKITVVEARTQAAGQGQGGRPKGSSTKQASDVDPFLASITSAANIAVNATPILTKEEFLQTAGKAYDKAEALKKEIAAQQSKQTEQGSVSAQPASQAQQAQAKAPVKKAA